MRYDVFMATAQARTDLLAQINIAHREIAALEASLVGLADAGLADAVAFIRGQVDDRSILIDTLTQELSFI